MSYWDSEHQIVVRFPPKRMEGHADWLDVDCGCCVGLEWGGESPRECSDCNGAGWYAVHIPTGTCARYPGGPLIGARHTEDEVRRLLAAVSAGGGTEDTK